MVLNFITKFADGSPTDFPLAIWKGLLDNNIVKPMVFEFHKVLSKKNNIEVLEGELPDHAKIHSLREDIHDLWGHGSMINFYVNARTKNCFEFGPYIPCHGTQKVVIDKFKPQSNNFYQTKDGRIYTVKVDGRDLHKLEIISLALNDGFKSTEDFFKYFKDGFDGKIIHWTDFRY